MSIKMHSKVTLNFTELLTSKQCQQTKEKVCILMALPAFKTTYSTKLIYKRMTSGDVYLF